MKITYVPKKTFINFNKADWVEFTQHTEDLFCSALQSNGAVKNKKVLTHH